MYIAKCYSAISYYSGTKYQLFVYRIIKLLLNITYPVYLLFNKKRHTEIGSGIIVSMTTFPQRIKTVAFVVESLLRQTHPPKKIILWLASTQFNNIRLPNRLQELEKYGLEIRYCEDIRSHKKYYYTMKEFPNENIVTVDDDTYYPENLLEKLYSAHLKHPDCVVAMLTHRIKYSDNGTPLEYQDWESAVCNVTEPSYDLVPIGCEGVFYPPYILNSTVFDKDFFMQKCKYADDLWLKAMSLMNNKKVYPVTDKPFTFVNLIKTQSYSLNRINNEGKGNNVQLQNIMERYPNLFKRNIVL